MDSTVSSISSGIATGILIVSILSWFALRGAERVNRLLGATGMVALTRLMGFLMICIGVQFTINGTSVIAADPEPSGRGSPRRCAGAVAEGRRALPWG